MDFRKKQKIRRVLYSRITIGILAFLVIIVGNAAWNVYEKERQARERLGRVEAEYKELTEREAFLKSEIERLSTKEGFEEEVRKQFGVAKEGENVIIIVEQKEGESAIRDASAGGFWGWIKSLFQ